MTYPYPPPAGYQPQPQRQFTPMQNLVNRIRVWRDQRGNQFGQDDAGYIYDLNGYDLTQGQMVPAGPQFVQAGPQFMGAEPGEDINLLGADADFLGGDAGDDAAMAEADDAADELLGAAWTDNDAMFGAKESRAERQLAKIEARVEHLRDKMRDIDGNGPVARMRRNSLQRRIDRKVRKMTELRSKVNAARRERQTAVATANQSVGKAAALAGGAALVGAGAGAVIASRDGQLSARPPAALINARAAQQLRDAQAQAGLRYNAVGGTGSGRLNKVQMYESGATVPRNALTVGGTGLATSTVLYTEDLPYAYVRIVGFTCSLYGTSSTAGAIGMVKDFKVKGGANLFLHENWGNADDYNTDDDQLRGLRDNPRLRSPNQAQVDINASGDDTDVVIMTCATVVDILDDDVHGPGLPGPYAG